MYPNVVLGWPTCFRWRAFSALQITIAGIAIAIAASGRVPPAEHAICSDCVDDR